jgi:hypothetical protein
MGTMMDAQSVRRQFDVSARSASQLELRLYWFSLALAERRGHIIAVQRSAPASGKHVASVDYEVPLPAHGRAGERKTVLGRATAIV